MPEKGTRSTYSQCPFQLYLHDQEGMISTGTGFYYSHLGDWYLITNWHNVAGRHFLTRDPLSKSKRTPTFIEAKLCSYLPNQFSGGLPAFTTVAHKVLIYKDFEPAWYEHPTLGSLCDVVALLMNRPETCPANMHNAANLISKTRIPVKPGNTAFVIGFPTSLSVGFGLPLWKSGYVASEPFYDVTIGGKPASIGGLTGGTRLPAFFIDSQTREGMSGAPVFASYTGNWDMSNPYRELDPSDKNFWSRDDVALGEHRMEFVGCYSGRIGKEEEGAALGLCWREEVIQQICSAKKRGTHPHVVPCAP